MLTKNDIKSIGNIIDEKLDSKLEPIKTDVSGLKEDLSGVKTEINVLKAHNVRIENKLDEMKFTFEDNLEKWKSDLFDRIDPILSRVTIAEEVFPAAV